MTNLCLKRLDVPKEKAQLCSMDPTCQPIDGKTLSDNEHRNFAQWIDFVCNRSQLTSFWQITTLKDQCGFWMLLIFPSTNKIWRHSEFICLRTYSKMYDTWRANAGWAGTRTWIKMADFKTLKARVISFFAVTIFRHLPILHQEVEPV